jgi:hypothetical protein
VKSPADWFLFHNVKNKSVCVDYMCPNERIVLPGVGELPICPRHLPHFYQSGGYQLAEQFEREAGIDLSSPEVMNEIKDYIISHGQNDHVTRNALANITRWSSQACIYRSPCPVKLSNGKIKQLKQVFLATCLIFLLNFYGLLLLRTYL